MVDINSVYFAISYFAIFYFLYDQSYNNMFPDTPQPKCEQKLRTENLYFGQENQYGL